MEKQNLRKKVDFRGFLVQYGPKFLLSLLVGLTAFLLIYFLNGQTLLAAVDGAFYAFLFPLVAGAFSFITNKGFFDIFAYNGLKIGYFFSPKRYERVDAFNGTYDYTKSRVEKRKINRFVYLSYLSAAILWLIATIVLYIIYRNI